MTTVGACASAAPAARNSPRRRDRSRLSCRCPYLSRSSRYAVASGEFMIASFSTMRRFEMAVRFLLRQRDERAGIAGNEESVNRRTLDPSVGLLVVDVDERVARAAPTEPCRAAFTACRRKSMFASEFATSVSARHRRSSSCPAVSVSGPRQTTPSDRAATARRARHHAELTDGFRSQLRRLLTGVGGEHSLLVAGHHERAKHLSLDVEVRRRASISLSTCRFAGAVVHAEILNRLALQIRVGSCLSRCRSTPAGHAVCRSAPGRRALAPSSAATGCPAGSARAAARPRGFICCRPESPAASGRHHSADRARSAARHAAAP